MDTITTIIVTAFLNLAISTGVFLRVQKNIELSFAKQLEMFKLQLQKEVIEHQIKFAKNYPKTLEVLETFTNKFRRFCVLFDFVHERMITKQFKDKVYTTEYFLERDEKRSEKLIDCTVYLEFNSQYLADAIVAELEDIVEKATKLNQKAVFLDVELHRENSDKKHMALEIIEPFMDVPLKASQNDEDVLDTYASVYTEEMQNLLRQVEKLYKSIAQLQ